MGQRADAELALKADAISEIREHLAALGIPVAHLTDDEIEAGVIELARAAADFGVYARDFADAIARLAKIGWPIG